ncbi:MAG TPA: 2-amino-4-hydroxy-6-hydroxymethyldihydropteridine diphosphokinase [Blastocatellia bacterium]|nr:2-amino-4-hydroxy-6-hydroxymethyldihydropteridine diphosphokinase [Blastocatellia bacterium]
MPNTRDPGGGEITVYIGLGSNLGDREANLREASSRIQELIKVVRRSSIYETEPVGLSEQPWFLNQVIEGIVLQDVRQAVSLSTSYATCDEADDKLSVCRTFAQAFLSELLKIETDLGRERTIVNGPRVIDIDLLLFGDRIIDHSKEDKESPGIDQITVVVPHPRMHTRRFVLEPLCEIAPDLIHPILQKTFPEILASLDDHSIVRRYEPTANS